MCTYLLLDNNEINSPDTSEMNLLDIVATTEMNVLSDGKVNALLFLWIFSHTSCISNLIPLLR